MSRKGVGSTSSPRVRTTTSPVWSTMKRRSLPSGAYVRPSGATSPSATSSTSSCGPSPVRAPPSAAGPSADAGVASAGMRPSNQATERHRSAVHKRAPRAADRDLRPLRSDRHPTHTVRRSSIARHGGPCSTPARPARRRPSLARCARALPVRLIAIAESVRPAGVDVRGPNTGCRSAAREDLVHGTVGVGDEVEVAVGSGVDVRDDPEVAPEEQALALGDLPLADVVGDAVFEPRVVDRHVAAVAGQLDAEQVAAREEVACAAHEQVAVVLRPERAAVEEADAAGRDLELPAQLGVAE